MSVKVVQIAQALDRQGNVVFESGTTLLAAVLWTDALIWVGVKHPESYLQENAPDLRNALTAFFEKLPDPISRGELDRQYSEALMVIVPVPWGVVDDPDFNTVEEILPEVREAALMSLLHRSGLPHRQGVFDESDWICPPSHHLPKKEKKHETPVGPDPLGDAAARDSAGSGEPTS